MFWTAVPPACASVSPKRWARTAASSRKFRTRRTKRRSRSSISTASSKCATSPLGRGSNFCTPTTKRIRAACKCCRSAKKAGGLQSFCRTSAVTAKTDGSTPWSASSPTRSDDSCWHRRARRGRTSPMKKLINDAHGVIDESLAGFCRAHADIVVMGEGGLFVKRRLLKQGKVALVSGGGSGHEPLHAGFVGRGMLDAACPGQVFTSPSPDQMIEAAEAVDTGAGVLFLVKNYEGDVMNFTMAAEMAGREVARVVTNDDVAVEKSTYTTGRRGVGGTLIVEKMVGAAAEAGMPLAALKVLGDEINRRTRSMGVALLPCTVPAAGRPNFTLADGG